MTDEILLATPFVPAPSAALNPFLIVDDARRLIAFVS